MRLRFGRSAVRSPATPATAPQPAVPTASSSAQAAVDGRTIPDLLDALVDQAGGARRKGRRGTYQRVLRCGALVMALGIAGLLWYLGARYTLDYLVTVRRFGPAVVAMGIAAYLLPLGITCVELALNPRTERRPALLILWFGILVFDALTTAVGFQLERSADTQTIVVPFFGVLGWIGSAVGLGLAYLPEKVGRGAAVALWEEMTR